MLLLEIVSTVDLETFIILETRVHAQGSENMILISQGSENMILI